MKKKKSWIYSTLITLFILQLITLPFVIKYTYAGRSESPDHTITYTTHKLKWDKGTTVGINGSAKLSLFDTYYKNVKSGNGDKVLAPGTKGDNTIRLKNNTNRTVDYTAVIYEIRDKKELNAKVSVSGNNFKNTKKYNLPKSIKNEKIIKAVKGNLEGKKIQDFDIDWIWDFEINDKVDTKLGNEKFDNKEDIVVGFYISVEDEGRTVAPQTGDSTLLVTYILFMGICGVSIIILFFRDKKYKRKKKENE